MSIKKIIQEAIDLNPLGVQEAVAEELKTRIRAALDEKKAKPDDNKTDDGEGMDPVGKGDADIDNDGEIDDEDEYLKKRRAAIAKAKKNESLDESASKYGVDTGPLMKANAWIKRQKLSKMVEDEELFGDALAIGYLTKPGNSQKSQVAIMVHDVKEVKRYFEKGLNKEHTFYYDTGRGHKQTQETITITGTVAIDDEGEVNASGRVDMNASTTLMVFK